jgi:hypothetical protein
MTEKPTLPLLKTRQNPAVAQNTAKPSTEGEQFIF